MSSSTQDMDESRPCKVRKLDLSDESQNVENTPSQVTTSSIRLENLVGGEKDQDHNKNDDNEEVLSVGKEDEPQVNNNNISKNQLKKLKKRERWEANRELRTKKRREKHKEKQLRKALQRKELSTKDFEKKEECDDRESSQSTDEEGEKKTIPHTKKHRRPTQVSIGLILDTAFNDLMTEKEIISLGAQLTRCYSLNKNAQFRTHLAVSSWGGTLKSRFENVLANTHLHWTGVVFLEDGDFIEAGKLLHDRMTEASTKTSSHNPSVDEESKDDDCNVVLPADEEPHQSSTSHLNSKSSVHEMLPPVTENPSLVYLTSDSPNTLTHLSPNTSYIIGGIVDKNRHKGICYKRACERGIPTAKLPIGEFMEMQSRTVLTVNHVVEIMLKWLETKNWGDAFLQVIPKRKQAVLKVEKNAKTQLGNCEEKSPNANLQGAVKTKIDEADKLVHE